MKETDETNFNNTVSLTRYINLIIIIFQRQCGCDISCASPVRAAGASEPRLVRGCHGGPITSLTSCLLPPPSRSPPAPLASHLALRRPEKSAWAFAAAVYPPGPSFPREAGGRHSARGPPFPRHPVQALSELVYKTRRPPMVPPLGAFTCCVVIC